MGVAEQVHVAADRDRTAVDEHLGAAGTGVTAVARAEGTAAECGRIDVETIERNHAVAGGVEVVGGKHVGEPAGRDATIARRVAQAAERPRIEDGLPGDHQRSVACEHDGARQVALGIAERVPAVDPVAAHGLARQADVAIEGRAAAIDRQNGAARVARAAVAGQAERIAAFAVGFDERIRGVDRQGGAAGHVDLCDSAHARAAIARSARNVAAFAVGDGIDAAVSEPVRPARGIDCCQASGARATVTRPARDDRPTEAERLDGQLGSRQGRAIELKARGAAGRGSAGPGQPSTNRSGFRVGGDEYLRDRDRSALHLKIGRPTAVGSALGVLIALGEGTGAHAHRTRSLDRPALYQQRCGTCCDGALSGARCGWGQRAKRIGTDREVVVGGSCVIENVDHSAVRDLAESSPCGDVAGRSAGARQVLAKDRRAPGQRQRGVIDHQAGAAARSVAAATAERGVTALRARSAAAERGRHRRAVAHGDIARAACGVAAVDGAGRCGLRRTSLRKRAWQQFGAGEDGIVDGNVDVAAGRRAASARPGVGIARKGAGEDLNEAPSADVCRAVQRCAVGCRDGNVAAKRRTANPAAAPVRLTAEPSRSNEKEIAIGTNASGVAVGDGDSAARVGDLQRCCAAAPEARATADIGAARAIDHDVEFVGNDVAAGVGGEQSVAARCIAASGRGYRRTQTEIA